MIRAGVRTDINFCKPDKIKGVFFLSWKLWRLKLYYNSATWSQNWMLKKKKRKLKLCTEVTSHHSPTQREQLSWQRSVWELSCWDSAAMLSHWCAATVAGWAFFSQIDYFKPFSRIKPTEQPKDWLYESTHGSTPLYLGRLLLECNKLQNTLIVNSVFFSFFGLISLWVSLKI